jgi:hypothetical protein
MGPSCGPRRKIERTEARRAGSKISLIVPAPIDVTMQAPKAWKMRRINNAPILGGSVERRILASRKLASVTI